MTSNAKEVRPADLADRFAPGFRLSGVDVLVLLLGAWGTWYVGRELWWAGVVIAFVVGHFFLFCNVFRIPRALELIWAAVYVLLSGATLILDLPGWGVTFGFSAGLTVFLVALAMKQPSYHGVFWRRVNPKLPDWWAERAALS